jgi:hypothetical protein
VDSPRFPVVEEIIHQNLDTGFDERVGFNSCDSDATYLLDFPDPFFNIKIGDLLWGLFFQGC